MFTHHTNIVDVLFPAFLIILLVITRVVHAHESEHHSDCSFNEIQLASDGTIKQRSLEIGERVTFNTTMNGSVSYENYNYYHLCIIRHEHEHQININLTTVGGGGDANLYISSLEKYPRIGHASWISQHPGNDLIKLFTYLDGFPRKEDVQTRSIALHIGVYGIQTMTNYNLTVSVLDLPITEDIKTKEKYYTRRHRFDQDINHVHSGTDAPLVFGRRLRSG